jgi:hypothetical protein
MREIFSMPRYPLTGLYEPVTEPFRDTGYSDQSFLYCEDCSHGKLGTIIAPEDLYGGSYSHRTGQSESARAAAMRFSKFIGPVDVDTVIDIGGNDGTLVNQFSARNKVIVDPHGTLDGGVVIPHFIHYADLSAYRNERKLILCSHTLEHIEDVGAVMDKVASIWREGDILAISVPSLEHLVADNRVDQIDHQHIHYFSAHSLGELVLNHGFSIARRDFDAMHWGALMAVCGTMASVRGAVVPEWKRLLFLWTMKEHFTDSLPVMPLAAVGFGAGPMVPVLRYWWPELENIDRIADNDKSKHGMRYINWDKPIGDYSLDKRNVVITAISSKLTARALFAEAFAKGARNVTVPLRTL